MWPVECDKPPPLGRCHQLLPHNSSDLIYLASLDLNNNIDILKQKERKNKVEGQRRKEVREGKTRRREEEKEGRTERGGGGRWAGKQAAGAAQGDVLLRGPAWWAAGPPKGCG